MKAISYTFSGGELSKGLWGRVDLNKYQTGVKRAENFHVAVEGGLTKRNGLYFVGKPKYQDKSAYMYPWRLADDDSYVLEFGNHYIRFIRLGGYVAYPGGGFVPHADSDAFNSAGFLEVPTPYDEDEAGELKFTFANDIVYVFHHAHAPRQLRRLGLYDWELEITSFSPHEAAPTGVAGTWQEWTGSWTDTTDGSGVDGYSQTQEDIQYQVSATMADGLETLASAPITISSDLGHQQLRNRITWAAKAGATKYTIYKGANGLFGFVGYVDPPTTEFKDKNYAASYDTVPLMEFEGWDKDDATQYPRVGEFYKQRMAYAATVAQPQMLWLSRPLFFNSLATSIPSQDDDAIKVPLVGRNRHTINHMVELKNFIIFTDSAEWRLGTLGNGALNISTIDPAPETYYGCDPYLPPIAIGDRVLFVQNISNEIRDMGYDFATDKYQADELSRLSRHLFTNKNIVAWDYAASPLNVFWTVFDDGSLAQMTYVREHEIWGWTRSETEGTFLDVACVAEINQHASYFYVRRIVNGVPTIMTERLELEFTGELNNKFFVDCGLTYSGAPTDSFTGFEHLANTTGNVALADGQVVTDISIDADGEFTLPFEASIVHCGRPYTAEIETLSLDNERAVGQYNMRTVDDIILHLSESRGVQVKATNADALREFYTIPSRSDENYEEANRVLDGAYSIPTHVGWDQSAGIIIRAEDPLPCTILNIVPDLIYGS